MFIKFTFEIFLYCLFLLGQHAVKAKTFHVCADKTPLIECKRGAEALTCMFEICFDFDLQYPSLPLTIEFFERYKKLLIFLLCDNST